MVIGIIIGILLGAIIGIVIMALMISSSYDEDKYSSGDISKNYLTEASNEITPKIDEDK